MQLECTRAQHRRRILIGELTLDTARLLWQQEERAGRALNVPVLTRLAEIKVVVEWHARHSVGVGY